MNLHGQIMNLPAKLPSDCAKMATATAYKTGHRDARHAAAELAIKADALADALRSIAKQDPVELMIDPQWAARVARITLTEAGLEA